jgi:hypothetical protein
MRRHLDALMLRAAPVAGGLLRRVGRGFPGVAGPVLVSIGLGLAWLPLGVIAAGAILWAVDLRLGGEPASPVRVAGRDPGRLRSVA